MVLAAPDSPSREEPRGVRCEGLERKGPISVMTLLKEIEAFKTVTLGNWPFICAWGQLFNSH